MSRELTDKVIVITGGSSGIGEATAIACAQAGMNVALGARREDRLQQVVQKIEQLGRNAIAVKCDVTKPEEQQQLMQQTWDTFGRMDAVFANAGYGQFTTVMDMTDEQHREIFDVNYFGTVYTIQAAVPFLRKTSDGLKQVLICSSAASEVGIPMFGAYCATKASQDSIAGALRAELHDEGFKVTSIHPVGTQTEFFDHARQVGNGPGVHANTPDSLTQTANDVAKCILKAIRKPKPEVWPNFISRFGLSICTFVPALPSMIMRKHMRKLMREQAQREKSSS